MAVRAETDPGHRRTMLDDVKRQAGEALRLDPSSADANALYGAATASLQAADAITAVSPATVATLSKQVTGEVLVDRVIQVEGPTDQLVTIYRGVERESYSCMPVCQRRVTLGDGSDYFKATMDQAGNLSSQASGAAASKPTN